jgi:hypothetical protein
MKFDIVWHDIVTPSGEKTIMFQTNQKAGFIFLDNQKWCIVCNKMCAHFGFIHVRPDHFGELNGQVVICPEL